MRHQNLDSDPSKISVVDIGVIFDVLWRGRWVIMLMVVLGAFAGAALALMLDNRYAAEMKLLVDPQSSASIGLGGRGFEAQPRINESLVESKTYMVRSNRVLETVVDELDLASNALFLGGTYEDVSPVLRKRLAMRFLNENMTVRQAGTSFVISVWVETGDPALSAAIANSIGRTFVDLDRAAKVATAQEASAWLLDRLAALQAKVTSSSQALESYRAITGLSLDRRISELSRDIDRQRLRLSDLNNAATEVVLDRIAETEARLISLTEKSVRLRELESVAEADRELYERFLDRAKEMEELESFQVADSRVIADALPPLEHSFPNRRLIVILFAILGAAGGVGLVTLTEILRRIKGQSGA